MEHELKIAPRYFIPVHSGRKPFEVRRDDRGFAVGDTILLREFVHYSNQYTGRKTRKRITYILRDPAYCKEGYCILGLAPEKED